MATFKIEDESARKDAIKGFYSGAALERKVKARKWYAIYKDQLKRYVRDLLLKETDFQTVHEMMNRIVNVNIAKKVVNKKARVYLNTVKRTVAKADEKKTAVSKIFSALMAWFKLEPAANPEEMTAQVEVVAKLLNLDQVMKRANRTVELHKNALLQVVCYEDDDEPGKYRLRVEVLHPGQYDVIEDDDDPTCAEVVVLLDPWHPKEGGAQTAPAPGPAQDGKGALMTRSYTGTAVPVDTPGIVKAPPAGQPVQVLEGSSGPTEDDLKQMTFVWWTKDRHFVTDGLGKIQTNKMPDDNKDGVNPIGTLPFIPISKDQDGCFFAIGGDDLVDNAVLVCTLLTDLNYIIYLHGTGLFYAIGPSVPARVKVGANGAIVMKTNSGETASTQIGFASANPNIDGHLSNVQQLVAATLSTNDLEPTAILGKGMSAESAASGIHELIKGSEVTTSIEDEHALYRDGESKLFQVIARWVNQLRKDRIACAALDLVGDMNPKMPVQTDFEAPKPFVSETDQITNWKLRLTAPAINTLEDIIKLDHPEWTDEQVKEQVAKIKAEKAENTPAGLQPPGPGDPNPKPGDKPVPPKPPVPGDNPAPPKPGGAGA